MKFGFIDLLAMYLGINAGLKEAEKERAENSSSSDLYTKSLEDFTQEDIDTLAKDAWLLSVYHSKKNKDGVFYPSAKDKKKINKLMDKYEALKDKSDEVSKAKVKAVETLFEVMDSAVITIKDYIVLLEGILS